MIILCERGDDVCVTCIVGGVILREMELPATPQAESGSTVSARGFTEGEVSSRRWRNGDRLGCSWQFHC